MIKVLDEDIRATQALIRVDADSWAKSSTDDKNALIGNKTRLFEHVSEILTIFGVNPDVLSYAAEGVLFSKRISAPTQKYCPTCKRPL